MQRLTCCSSFPSLVAARLGPDSTVLGWSTNRTGPDLVPRLSLGVLESTSMWIAGGRETLIPAACRSVEAAPRPRPGSAPAVLACLIAATLPDSTLTRGHIPVSFTAKVPLLWNARTSTVRIIPGGTEPSPLVQHMDDEILRLICSRLRAALSRDLS